MKSTGQIGMKITSATREFHRYTGPSEDLERRGAGTSRQELAWARRHRDQEAQVPAVKECNANPR